MAGKKTEKKQVNLTDAEWSEIENQIKARTFKLSEYSVVNDYVMLDMRNALLGRFGENIEFRRGRTGGVFWKGN